LSELITHVIYDVEKRHGRMPTDTLITIKPRTKEVTLKPIKGMNQTLRRELLSAVITRGYSLTITANQ